VASMVKMVSEQPPPPPPPLGDGSSLETVDLVEQSVSQQKGLQCHAFAGRVEV
jgi:hypothetical protein